MLTKEQRHAKGDAIRQGDATLLAAMIAAGWRTADKNATDRVTAYLTDNGFDIAPQSVIDWSLIE